MAAELNKITLELHDLGYDEAAKALARFTQESIEKRIIPPDLNEGLHINVSDLQFTGDFPKFKLTERPERIPQYIYEIDLFDLPSRVRNALARQGFHSIDKLITTTDEELLDLRIIGLVGLNQIKSATEQFRADIIKKRAELQITDDQPLTIPYPHQTFSQRQKLLKKLLQDSVS